ncbi:MAG: LacI family DNA-binding transcriptional regulator [Propionibacteriaceae bacterium]
MTRRTTISDIARRAGVSAGAVSYALNGRPGVSQQTRARILAVAEDAGWRPNLAARSLTVSRAQAVGWVIARSTPTIGVEPFFTQVIAGLERELSAANVALLLQVTHSQEKAIAATRRWWAESRIDGVILTDMSTEDPRVPLVVELGIPAVIMGEPFADCDVPAVWHNEQEAVDAVIDYLVALGHRRISWVSGLPRLVHTQNRKRAYAAALARHELAPPTPPLDTDYTRLDGERATRSLLTVRRRPTAIVYDNDVMAVSALTVVRELGLSVPDDVSIVSIDDSELCVLVTPALTALSRDTAAYAELTARTLLDQLDADEPLAAREVASGVLVPRASTSAPPPRRS